MLYYVHEYLRVTGGTGKWIVAGQYVRLPNAEGDGEENSTSFVVFFFRFRPFLSKGSGRRWKENELKAAFSICYSGTVLVIGQLKTVIIQRVDLCGARVGGSIMSERKNASLFFLRTHLGSRFRRSRGRVVLAFTAVFLFCFFLSSKWNVCESKLMLENERGKRDFGCRNMVPNSGACVAMSDDWFTNSLLCA